MQDYHKGGKKQIKGTVKLPIYLVQYALKNKKVIVPLNNEKRLLLITSKYQSHTFLLTNLCLSTKAI